MLVKLKVMFLGMKTGNNEDGSSYYQAQFLDKSSNQTFRVYYKDAQKVNQLQPYKDYELDFDLYINQKGLWAIKSL